MDGLYCHSCPFACLESVIDCYIAVGGILHSLLHYPTCLMDLWVLELAGSLSI